LLKQGVIALPPVVQLVGEPALAPPVDPPRGAAPGADDLAGPVERRLDGVFLQAGIEDAPDLVRWQEASLRPLGPPPLRHPAPALVDARTGHMDTLPTFRQTIAAAGLEDVVVGVIGDSPSVARYWSTPLALLFIDGGHGEAVAWADYRAWTPKVAPGGLLA